MNPNMTDKGLGTSPDKESSISSATMENQQQSKPKASQAAAPTLTTSLEDANDAKGQTSPKAVTSTTILTDIEPKVPTTLTSSEQEAISSSESSEYEDDLPLPTFPYRPSESSLTQNIRPQTWTPQVMGKKEADFSTTSLGQKGLSKSPDVQRKGDPKTAASAIGVDTKILPGISPIVKAAVPDNTGKFPLTLNAPILQGVNTKALPRTKPIVEATVPDTTGKFQLALNSPIAEGVDTKVLPGIDPTVKATAPDTISQFQFTLSTPIPQQPAQYSAAKPFLFTREAKQPLKEAQFGPVKRRVVKPSRIEEDDDDAPKFPPMVFDLPESFDFKPQDKKPAEDSKFLPVKTSFAEAFTIVPQAIAKPIEEKEVVSVKEPKKPVQEPQSTATVLDTTVKFPLTLNAPILQDVKTKILPGLDTIEKATVSEITGKFPLSSNTAVLQGVDSKILPIPKTTVSGTSGNSQLTLSTPIPQDEKTKILPGLDTIAKATASGITGKFPLSSNAPVSQDVDSKTLPGRNPIVEATVPDTTGKFQVTLDTPTPQSVNKSVRRKLFTEMNTIAEASVRDTIKPRVTLNAPIPQDVKSKISPGIKPIAKATVPNTTKVPFTLDSAVPKDVDTKIIPGNNPVTKATVADDTEFPFTLNTAIAGGVDTKILPDIDPVVKATVPDTPGKFQFTLNTPIPQQPVKPSAAEPFLFTREAKQPLKEAQFGPVKRRVDKPSRMEDDDDDAPKFPPMVFNLPESFDFMPQDKKPVEDSKFLPVKSSLAEAFTIAPQTTTKLAEEQKVIPVEATLARPPTHTNAAKTPIQEPQPIPVKSPLTKKSVLKQQARQSTALPELPATKLSAETESTQPTAQNVGRQEEKLDDDKKAQRIRELLAEKIELRSQRNALAMEKAALEAKLQGQAKEEEGRKALSARNDQQATELENLRSRLVKETEAKEKAKSRANRLQKTIDKQVDALREAGVKKAELQAMVDNQGAELAKNQRQQAGLQAEADIGLANAVMERERARVEGEDRRREGRLLGTLENLREEGRRSRQRLMDELEAKDAELHEAKMEVRELGESLLASSQATAEALVAASASNVSPSSPSPLHQISIPTPPSSSTSSTAMPWFQLNLSPRRLLILLFIFFLAFLFPLFHFNSLSQPAAEERGWSMEVGGPRHQRIIEEARILEGWEQEAPVTTAEEGWRRTREAARVYDDGF